MRNRETGKKQTGKNYRETEEKKETAGQSVRDKKKEKDKTERGREKA